MEKTEGGGNSEPPTCPQSVGGFHLNLGEAEFAGNILQGILPITTLSGSICKAEKDYSTLLLIIPVLKGFFFLALVASNFGKRLPKH